MVAGRKVRPISLAEAWVKLADKIAVGSGAKNFRAQIEPVQLGAGYPDGVVAVVRCMRRWACAIEEAAQWCADNAEAALTPEGQEAAAQAECVLVGTDIRNAFGNMYRSGAIGAIERLCPALARLLASSWSQGTLLWARTGQRQWACHEVSAAGRKAACRPKSRFVLTYMKFWEVCAACSRLTSSAWAS